jgi:hypothetical protein
MAAPFQPKFVDLVRNYSTTVGTDDFVLGPAVNGFTDFAAALQPGDTFYYSAIGVDNPAETEVGRGTLTVTGTISRDPISGTKTNFSSGTKSLALIAAADWFTAVDASAGVGSRSAMAALARTDTAVLLTETGREGHFIFDPTDLSAEVSADSNQGVYVAPASDPTGASGCWIRKFTGPLQPLWFGMVEGDTGTFANAATNNAAWAALQNTRFARAKNSDGLEFRGLEKVQFPLGTFEFSAPLDIQGGMGIIEGHGGAMVIGSQTILKFQNCSGFRVLEGNDSGDNLTTGGSPYDAHGSGFRDLMVEGNYAGTEAEYHGIYARAEFFADNVTIFNFAGDGYHIDAQTNAPSGNEPPHGNASACRVTGGRVQSCRRGIYTSGSDANIGIFTGVEISNNRWWGIFDNSFIGNTYSNGQVANNGYPDSFGSTPSVVTFSGNWYGCILGQEVGASTNAPSGTTANNTWWYYISAGTVSSVRPAWVSGTTYRAGGPVGTGSNGFSKFRDVYCEVSQPKAQLTGPAVIEGGFLSDAGNVLYIDANNNGVIVTPSPAGNAFWQVTPGIRVSRNTSTGATVDARFGDAATANNLLYFNHSALANGTYRWMFDEANALLRFNYGNGGFNADVFDISVPGGTSQFGTGTSLSHVFYAPQIAIGGIAANPNNARRVWIETAAPTTGAHGRGEISWNLSAAVGQPIGWRCTVGGTPGTWEAFYNGLTAGSTGIGYVTGAGGTVTQATSKSTGVTLNKVCGEITMNAAALAAGTAVSFVLANSAIGANDNIILNHVATGTFGAYALNGRCAAGSATIDVRNLSAATLSEPIVVRFTVIKSVTA